MTKFLPFPKIGRFSRDMYITEKLDGTNAQVHVIDPDEATEEELPPGRIVFGPEHTGPYLVVAGSRNRYVVPEKGKDNFGFAGWVYQNAPELVKLGVGRHFGEWWGQGIQRGYGLTEKRFSLFNVNRWIDPHTMPGDPVYGEQFAPDCCHVVPVLFKGPFSSIAVSRAMDDLKNRGSEAAPGYFNPEGIVIFHTGNGALFKKTYDHDEKGKEAA